MPVIWGIVSFSCLNTLFFTHLQPCHLQIPQTQLQPSQLQSYETSTEPNINIAHDTILWLEHHRAVWWLPAVSQISGELVHPTKHSSGDTRGSHCGTRTPFDSEYMLNFLGNTGCRKFDHWKPTGTADEIARKKKWATAFMDYLSLTMDHTVSQCCRIYQLEDVRIWPGESPDELVDHLWALADWCNFPTEDEKEWNIKYRFVRALSDKELIKKLLALDLMATTSRMLEVCYTHFAISDNFEAMGLKEQKKKTVNAIWRHNKPCQGKKPPADSVHSCGCCTKSHPPGRSSCPARDDHCWGCGKLGHWKPKCWNGQKGPKDKGTKHHNRGGKQRKVNKVGTDEDPHCDEVGVVAVVLQTPFHREWLTARYMRSNADPETIELSDVQIDSTTEAFATVQMPAEIGPNKLVTLKYKVDNSAGGNVMPLHAFAKLFPRHINANGSPRGLKSSTTCLTAYNRSKIPQFGTLNTAIDWTPKGKDVANCLWTRWYVADTQGPAILGLPSCAKLGIVELNCAVNLQKRKLVQQKKPTTEGRNSQPRSSTPQLINPSTQKKTSSRHIRIDSKELAISQERTTSPYAVMQNPSYMHRWKCPIAMQPLVRGKTRWVPGTRNHHPSGGAHGLGILTCLLVEGKWQAESLLGSKRCQQSHQERSLQDSHCWRDHTSTGRKQEVHQGWWNLIISLHSPWLWIIPSHHIQHTMGKVQICIDSPGAYHVPRISSKGWWTRYWNGARELLELLMMLSSMEMMMKIMTSNLHNFMCRAREHSLVFNGEKCEVKKDSVTFFSTWYMMPMEPIQTQRR